MLVVMNIMRRLVAMCNRLRFSSGLQTTMAPVVTIMFRQVPLIAILIRIADDQRDRFACGGMRSGCFSFCEVSAYDHVDLRFPFVE